MLPLLGKTRGPAAPCSAKSQVYKYQRGEVNECEPSSSQSSFKFHLILKVTYRINRAWLLACVPVALSQVILWRGGQGRGKA